MSTHEVEDGGGTNGSSVTTNGKSRPPRKRPTVAPELTETRHCEHCDTTIEPTWEFCGGCGKSVTPPEPKPVRRARRAVNPVTEEAVSAPMAPTTAVTHILPVPDVQPAVLPEPSELGAIPASVATSRRGLRLRDRWPWLAVVAVLVLVGSLVALNDSGTHTTLSQTRSRLTSTRASLTSTKSQLTNTQGQLAQRTTERDALQAKLTSTQSELTGVQGTLSQAQSQISLQAGQITTVKTCLDGISTALSDDLNGDYSGGLSALIAVQTSCQAAQNIVGG